MIKVAFFSVKPYDEDIFNAHINSANSKDTERGLSRDKLQASYFTYPLNEHTAISCQGFDAVCVFVNDEVNKATLTTLAKLGIKHVALRCAGFNNVDVKAAKTLAIAVTRVPAYSPETVAEHTLALMLTLNRKTHKAYNRVKEGNFSLDGLMGFTLHNKTVGIIGSGKIGQAVIRILTGFGCNILCYDPAPCQKLIDLGVRYTTLEDLFVSSQIVSLHCPLTHATEHIINAKSLALMPKGVMLINTSRGGLVDDKAVIHALKQGHLGYLGLDVYERESELFFSDHSQDIIQDDTFQRLLTFPNVLVTGHQGFFTHEALNEIANTTLKNIHSCANGCLKTTGENWVR
ncbi:2-hydroxyacid dehydrogenase [Alteromonas sp. 345S023]|uniref:2-hydroxyacid dehydrogenase n=1 Tax=Alteromonas profundi TaxID=2696062 RepID=A0A7X5LNM7_9ALTE|nr:2-hydroxyacid dehydrogenase [Alteromonas profundi]NDV92720.1 2-hydroxyacid dehydrogenase [Alteromonas profundi]